MSERYYLIEIGSSIPTFSYIPAQQLAKDIKSKGHLGMKEIVVRELKRLRDEQEDFQLIDVREAWEYEKSNLGGLLLPMKQAENAVDQIARDKKVIVHCYRGHRSAKVIKILEKTHNFDNLYNLKGGLLAYAREVDHTLPTY